MLQASGTPLRILTTLVARFISENFKSIDFNNHEWRHPVNKVSLVTFKMSSDGVKFKKALLHHRISDDHGFSHNSWLLNDYLRLDHGATTDDSLRPVLTLKVDVTSWEPIKEKFNPFGTSTLSCKAAYWNSGLTQELAANHILVSDFNKKLMV